MPLGSPKSMDCPYGSNLTAQSLSVPQMMILEPRSARVRSRLSGGGAVSEMMISRSEAGRVQVFLKLLTAFAVILLAAGCGESSESARDRGYSDGYAAGYNTTCQIRSTLIAGDWDNKAYSEGYQQGYSAGALACQQSRQNN